MKDVLKLPNWYKKKKYLDITNIKLLKKNILQFLITTYLVGISIVFL